MQMLGLLDFWSESANSGVMVMLAALIVAVVLSTLRVLCSRVYRLVRASRHRKASFLENLDFIAPRTGSQGESSSGVDNLKPLPKERSSPQQVMGDRHPSRLKPFSGDKSPRQSAPVLAGKTEKVKQHQPLRASERPRSRL